MQSNGLATILLMIPVITVPALAIFGIPQFAPVVASPLEEGSNNDREKRVGNSARLSHDELFDDADGFDSEQDVKTAAPSLLKRSSSNSSQRSSRIRRMDSQSNPTWGDDLERIPNNPKPNRYASTREPGEQTTGDRSSGDRVPKMALNSDPPSHYQRSPRPLSKNFSRARTITPDETDHPIKQIGYSDDFSDRENRLDSSTGNRPKTIAPRTTKVREPAVEDLTWSSAVERLNELEIRSFRLEPGPRLGLFVFICSYTAPDAPSVAYRFEAEADQPLKAVQQVLEQIVDWRQLR